MIDRNHALPITRQAELAGISRGNVYYLARAVSECDQRLMKRIDTLNLAHPFAGSRMLRDMLMREGFEVGRRHVATLMRRMGIEALASPTPARSTRRIRSIRTCCASSRSSAPTRSGPPTSHISRWPAAGSTCARSSTGRAGESSHTECRSAWTPRFAWRRSRKHSPSTASPRSSTPTRAASLGSRSRRTRFE